MTRNRFANKARSPGRTPGLFFALGWTAATVFACASPASAQISELATIRDSAATIAARSRELTARAGAAYQQAALDAVRRSCAGRAVTRLDETAPAAVTTDSSDAAVQPLLDIDFVAVAAQTQEPIAPAAAAGTPGPLAPGPIAPGVPGPVDGPTSGPFTAVHKDTVFETGAQGLVLRHGQVRTAAPFAIDRDAIGTIEIDIRTAAPGELMLGWSDAADAPRLRRNNARLALVGDGRIHTYVVDAADTLARGLAAGASLRRFFLATRSDAALEIRALRVLPRLQRYAGKAFGTTHEARGAELRSVLFLRPATTLGFDVDVPAEAPVFESGIGVLARDGVVEFQMAVVDGDARTVLLKRLVKSAPWEDVAIDLDAWKGKHVRVSLAVRGSRDAVALWSSPLVRARLGADRTEPFLVILEDALRVDRLSIYGGSVASPAHERLAASGVVFEHAFSQATQTRSSVASLMTSLLPSANGTWDFSDSLSERYVTLAETLRACGFATASFVQNGNAGPYAGLAQGFDVVFSENGTGERSADLLAADSPLGLWIARQRGRSWFAYVHLLDPHGPYDPADPPDLTTAASGAAVLRDRSLDAARIAKPTAEGRRLLYDAEVAANDRALGAFFDRLDAAGDLARAVVAVVADHGEFLGEHGGLWRHHPPAHVEVAHVPFLLRAPGIAPRRIGDPVGLLDLMPTLLNLAKVDASAIVMHGESLTPLLQGKPLAARAIPADEMLLAGSERRASGCGSFATPTALWLLSCTRDEDYSPSRLLPQPSSGQAGLRRIDLGAVNFGAELPVSTLSQSVLEGLSRRALAAMQADDIALWKRMTDSGTGKIVTEPDNAERLRALGYTE